MKPSFADAHVHLFNMADLPTANFLKYVAIPQRFPNAPRWAAAIVDLVANVLKDNAVTAEEELRSSGQGLIGEGITPDAFGEAVASHMQARMLAPAIAGSEASLLAESYRELNLAIAADSSSPAARLQPAEEADAGMVAEVARKADGGPIQPGDIARQRDIGSLGATSFADAVHLLGWTYIMLLARRDHARRYQRRFLSSGKSVLVLNHLVDYDFWLDEEPSAGSDLLAQIEVMDAIRVTMAPEVDLRLFAGFCPLKLAIERLSPGPTTFDRLLALVKNGKVHGFKLYPPMGFQPIGNARLKDDQFCPPERGRVTALDRWREAGAPRALGEALDDALSYFYGVCATRRIPMMAHAANSNGAGPGYAGRANPAFWATVVNSFDIRLILGHLVDCVGSFVAAVEGGPPYPPHIWSLATATSLLDPSLPRSSVYADLGYTEELLEDRKLACRFFKSLRVAFGVRDPQLTRIVYGSDWIMLGLERHDERYLECAMRGMRDAGYTESDQRNILENNLRGGLGVDGSGP